MHRIEDIALTDKEWFFHIPDENLAMFGLPRHEPRTFRIKFKTEKAAQYVEERIWSDRQKIIKQIYGGVILEMTSCSEPEVMAWVRSFGDEAELLD